MSHIEIRELRELRETCASQFVRECAHVEIRDMRELRETYTSIICTRVLSC